MITDLKDVGEYITQKNLWEKPLCQFSRLEIEMFCQAILEYTETKDFKPPYINNRSELIIPFEAPVKYRWWQQGGQSLEATLNELGADDEIKKKYICDWEGYIPRTLQADQTCQKQDG